MTQTVVLGIIRALLATAGGGLIANGTVSSDQWQQIAGGILAVLAAAWSWWQKHEASKTLVAAANAVPPAVPAVTHADALAVAQGAQS